jgi:hypothetical protein
VTDGATLLLASARKASLMLAILVRKRKVGADAFFVDLDDTVDHELPWVGAAAQLCSALDVR